MIFNVQQIYCGGRYGVIDLLGTSSDDRCEYFLDLLSSYGRTGVVLFHVSKGSVGVPISDDSAGGVHYLGCAETVGQAFGSLCAAVGGTTTTISLDTMLRFVVGT